MKVLLINPPAPERFIREGRCTQKRGIWATQWPPLTLSMCAAVLEEAGIEARILDCAAQGMDFPELERQALSYSPDLIVLSTSTPSIRYDFETIKLLKSAFPETKTAALGVHVSVLTGEAFESCRDLDFVIRREPEYTLRDLALALRDNKGISSVAGISFRDRDGIRHNPDRPFIDNLDELPFPAWHLVDISHYTLPLSRRPFLSIFSARGCPFSCSFCTDHVYYGKKLRRRSPTRIVDELAYMKEHFHLADFLFWTESFTFSRDLVIALAEEISKRALNIRWFCNSRVDNVDKVLLLTMKRSGCTMISFGIESLDNRVLDAIKKGTTAKQAERAVKLSHECGLETIAHCILGLPGDSEEAIRSTVRDICRLPVDYAQFYGAVPFPGTELYDQVKERIRKEYGDWTYFEQGKYIIDSENLDADKVNKLIAWAYRAFYFHPRHITKLLKALREGGSLSSLSRVCKEFVAWVTKR